ncbi:hypothetical protein BH10ACI3_BH10ACI3_26490 [soil metagenome]
MLGNRYLYYQCYDEPLMVNLMKKIICRTTLMSVVVFVLALSGIVAQPPPPTYVLTQSVIASGGGLSTGSPSVAPSVAQYSMEMTLAQALAGGPLSSSVTLMGGPLSYKVNGGFWFGGSGTATSVSSSANTSVYGDNVIFTATISPIPSGGTVQFNIDGTDIGSPVLVDGMGIATYSTAALTVNGSTPHTVTASYSGFWADDPSSGSLTPGQTVNAAPTVTTVTCTPGPFVYNGLPQMPCSATVTGAGGLNQPLMVMYGPNTNAGPVTASASYPGDMNHTPSDGNAGFTIDQATTTTTVTFEGGPYVYRGIAFTASAEVTGIGLQGFMVPATVTYSGDCTNVTISNGCSANASYAGDANHAGSIGSGSITITQKSAVWTTAPSNKIFADADPVPLTTGLGSGFLISDNVTATYSRVGGEAVSGPTYHITATLSTLGVLSNYAITNAGAEFTIIGRTLTGTVTLENAAVGVVPIPDTIITSAGTSPLPGTVLTDAGGGYSVTGFGASSYTITPSKTPYLVNAFNGIFANDVSMVSRHVVGLSTLTAEQIRAAKVSGNATLTLTSYDAALIAQYLVGIQNPINQTGTWKYNAASASLIVQPDSVQNFYGRLMGDVNGDWTPETPPRPEPLTDPYRIKNAVQARMASYKVQPGTEVLVPFRLDNLKGAEVGSYQFDIQYDPYVVTSSELAADLAGTMGENMSIAFNTPEKGLLKVVVYGAYPAQGDGVYVNLRFVVSGVEGTSTPLTISGFRLNDGSGDVYTTDGKLIVVSPRGKKADQ